MPHQCTNCGYVFDDGSKEMLTGCPGCGGNKFQYHPGEVPNEPTSDDPPERPGESGVTGTVGKAAAKVRNLVSDDEPERAPAATKSSPATSTESQSTTASSSTNSPTGDASADTPPETDQPASRSPATADTGTSTEPSSTASSPDTETDSEEVPDRDDEDVAQQSARSEMVSENDLPESSERESSSERPPSPDRGRVVSEPNSDERPDMEALREELNSQFESIRIVSPGKYELNLMELYDREEYIIALQENGRYVIEVPDAWEVENADETE